MKKIIGILGMHGSREEHAAMMHKLGYDTIFLREEKNYKNISGIILPGGESTSFGKLLKRTNTRKILEKKILQDHIPVFGTCAGAILLSQKGSDYCLKALDININRNAYGTQIQSFSDEINIKNFSSPFHALFIRAPQIESIGKSAEKNIEILAEYNNQIVLAHDIKNNILVSTFHPELTSDTRIHKIFADMVEKFSMC